MGQHVAQNAWADPSELGELALGYSTSSGSGPRWMDWFRHAFAPTPGSGRELRTQWAQVTARPGDTLGAALAAHTVGHMRSDRKMLRAMCPECDQETEVIRVWWSDRMRWKVAEGHSRLTEVKIVPRTGAPAGAQAALMQSLAEGQPLSSLPTVVSDAAALERSWAAELRCPACRWSGRYQTQKLVQWLESQRDALIRKSRLPDPRDYPNLRPPARTRETS